jgi:hypothetical protein
MVILSAIEILTFSPPLQGKLVDETIRKTLLIEEVREISPKMSTCLNGEDDTCRPSAIMGHK